MIGSRCLHFRSDAAAGIVCVATRRAARATGCGILHAARQRSWRTNARSSTGASTAAFDVKQTAKRSAWLRGRAHRPRQVGTSRDALGRPGRDPANLATGTRLVALPFDQFVTTIRAGPSVRRRRRGGHDSVGRTAARPMNDARLVRGRGVHPTTRAGSGALGPLPHIGEPRVGPGLTTTRLRERGPCRGSSQCVEQSTTPTGVRPRRGATGLDDDGACGACDPPAGAAARPPTRWPTPGSRRGDQLAPR